MKRLVVVGIRLNVELFIFILDFCKFWDWWSSCTNWKIDCDFRSDFTLKHTIVTNKAIIRFVSNWICDLFIHFFNFAFFRINNIAQIHELMSCVQCLYTSRGHYVISKHIYVFDINKRVFISLSRGYGSPWKKIFRPFITLLPCAVHPMVPIKPGATSPRTCWMYLLKDKALQTRFQDQALYNTWPLMM